MRPRAIEVADRPDGGSPSLALPSLEAPRAAILDEPEGWEGVWDTLGMDELLDALDDSRGG